MRIEIGRLHTTWGYVHLMTLRNDKYAIEIRHQEGRLYYTFRERDGRWRQEVVNGKIHDVTAEQVLGHFLSVLSGIKSGVEIAVRYTPDNAAAQD